MRPYYFNILSEDRSPHYTIRCKIPLKCEKLTLLITDKRRESMESLFRENYSFEVSWDPENVQMITVS